MSTNEETAKNRELYEFLQSNNKSHYLQSPEWARVKTNWKHEMLVVKNNEKIIGTMSVLLKKVPLFNSYMMYAPRGFICNSDNKEALQKLTEEVKKLQKSTMPLFSEWIRIFWTVIINLKKRRNPWDIN